MILDAETQKQLLEFMTDEIPTNRRWRSSPEIAKELAANLSIEDIRLAATLQTFVRNALPAKGYRASPEWEHVVAMSPAGIEALRLAGISPSDEVSRADISMAMFCLFSHHELLVDFAKCDLKALLGLVNAELLSGKLLLPHRFGRLLYDKFNDSYSGDRTDHLLPDEALELVKDTPQGVYQVGHWVSGPLGLLEAACGRFVPPTRSLMLWHCSDPGCQSPHFAKLLPAEVSPVQVFREVRKALETQLGPASEWSSPLADELGCDIPRQPYTYFDVTTLIADCVIGEERSALVAAALAGNHSTLLREVLGRPPRKKTAGRGAPDSLAKGLGEEERLQLLFLLGDRDLIGLIDQCTERGSINIPLTEKRRARFSPPSHVRTPSSELSSLGIRCAGDEALLDLCALIWEEYSSSGRTSELDWRLHNRMASGTRNMLLDYLSKNDPASALKELVLASEPVTKGLCERLKCPVEDVTNSKFVDRLLWKLGFDLPRFSDTLALLKRRLESFSQELLAVGTLREERDRERIRAAGVNLFVSVEEFLEKVICFNVWLLSSDHFLGTKFRYYGNDARRRVSEVLGPSIDSGGTTMAWSVDNRNTLGSLMGYLNATANWMKTLLGSQRDPLLRPKADLPDFAEDNLRVFPFQHTQLWADCDYGCLERVANGFATIMSKIARSNLAAVRNGIDHQRDEAAFPKGDEMLAFVAYLREAVDLADVNRYFPKEFWLERSEEDRFGRVELEFRDYLGRPHVFYGPSFAHGIPGVGTDRAVVISPGNLLGHANAELVFAVRETSAYSRYWEGYPRRRQIPNGSASVQTPSPNEAGQNEAQPVVAG